MMLGANEHTARTHSPNARCSNSSIRTSAAMMVMLMVMLMVMAEEEEEEEEEEDEDDEDGDEDEEVVVEVPGLPLGGSGGSESLIPCNIFSCASFFLRTSSSAA